LIPVDELEVNVTGELSTSYLSMILENKVKREGVKKLEETRGKNMTDAEKYAILKDHTNMTLGKLCANGIHTLSRPEVLNCAQLHQNEKDMEK
jgi:hypothetical protein